MSTDHPSTKPRPAGPEFPALRSFLRGYFHQDMKDEYGTPAEAVREFCADASADERAAVAEDWSRFLKHTQGQSLDQVNRILTGDLGSSYILSAEDLQQISSAFARAAKTPKN